MKDSARCAWVVVSCVTACALAASSVAAQDVDDFEDWQVAEMASLVNAVAAARAGQSDCCGDSLEFMPSHLKGADGNTYTPFTLLIDSSEVEASNVVTHVVLTAPTDATTAAAEDAELPEPLFEDAFYSEVDASGSGPVRISRALQAPGGEYDLYIAIRDSLDGDAPVERILNPRTRRVEEVAFAANIVMHRERITLPDLWNDELQTSTVLLTAEVEPLAAPPTPEDLALFPYTIGGTRVVPKLDSNFGKEDVLGFVFLIYNTDHDDGMPDVTVDYDFYTQTAGGEEFFNSTEPQVMNNQTLPPSFDVTEGFQLVTGQNIPLGGFPAGSYRLEIKVTDNEGSNELTKDLLFTVAES